MAYTHTHTHESTYTFLSAWLMKEKNQNWLSQQFFETKFAKFGWLHLSTTTFLYFKFFVFPDNCFITFELKKH